MDTGPLVHVQSDCKRRTAHDDYLIAPLSPTQPSELDSNLSYIPRDPGHEADIVRTDRNISKVTPTLFAFSLQI